MNLLIENLSELATPRGTQSRSGADQGRIERLSKVEVLSDEGVPQGVVEGTGILSVFHTDQVVQTRDVLRAV